jgi:uncharacterized protein YecE (DUF72 family)
MWSPASPTPILRPWRIIQPGSRYRKSSPWLRDSMIRIGTAGWTIPRQHAEHFPAHGSGLERYAARFNAAEINSTFYRSHKPQTYARWIASVPADFRFSVKMPKGITHERRLVDVAGLLDRFADEIAALGAKLGPVLIQLPPSFAFDARLTRAFLRQVRKRIAGPIACEPRHPTWFAAEPEQLLSKYHVARVAADPARVPDAALPGGAASLAYFRLHGSPRMYYSEYDAGFLETLTTALRASKAEHAWCIFDNTVSGAAAGNAVTIQQRVGARAGS